MTEPVSYTKVFDSPAVALSDLFDGASILISGHNGTGVPESLIRAVIASSVSGLTCVCQGAWPHGPESADLADLAESGKVSKLITPQGFDPTRPGPVKQSWEDGRLQVEIVPQGVLAEQLRAGGAGLGGVFIPEGVGTRFQDGQEVRIFNGREHIFRPAIRADFALLRADAADLVGNLTYQGTQRNWNPVMAMAARISVAEVDEIFEPGGIDPELVVTPGIFVDRIVQTL